MVVLPAPVRPTRATASTPSRQVGRGTARRGPGGCSRAKQHPSVRIVRLVVDACSTSSRSQEGFALPIRARYTGPTAEVAGLSLRRPDKRVRLHAEHRRGQRPHPRLLPRRRSRRSGCDVKEGSTVQVRRRASPREGGTAHFAVPRLIWFCLSSATRIL